MWFAPIGSLEYTKNLHNDLLIKKYILSEQRLKQFNNAGLYLTIQELSLLKSRPGYEKKKVSKNEGSNNMQNKQSNRINRIKGCAVDIVIKRSFKKTNINVVTYDSQVAA